MRTAKYAKTPSVLKISHSIVFVFETYYFDTAIGDRQGAPTAVVRLEPIDPS